MLPTIIMMSMLYALGLAAGPINLNYTTCEIGNPFIPRAYGYPDACVDGFNSTSDLYWVFNANYPNGANNETIDAYSSPDLITWRPYTVLFRRDFNWSTGPIYSVAKTKRNDTHYLYFSTTDSKTPNLTSIGVGVAAKPEGPYTDPIGKALLTTNNTSIYATVGPSVIITGDNHDAYLYYASEGKAYVAKLEADMTELTPSAVGDGQNAKDITPQTNGTLIPFPGDPKMLERNGHFYLSWKETQDGTIRYAMADSPTGPFTDRGRILEPDPAVADSIGHATHLHIANSDIWYMVYSRRLSLDGDADFMSGLAYDRVHFNESDGSIQPVQMRVTHTFDHLDSYHEKAIWKEYRATYGIGADDGVNRSYAIHRFAAGDGDGRSMMYNNFSDLVYDVGMGLGKYNQSTMPGADPETGGDAGVVFRVTVPLVGGSDYENFEGYYVGISHDKILKLGVVNGTWTELRSVTFQSDVTFDPRGFNCLRIKAVAQNISVWANPYQCKFVNSEPNITVIDGTYSHGRTGTRAFNTMGRFYYLNISTPLPDGKS